MSDLQLLSKVNVGGQELQNRVVLAPMTRARGTPTEDPFDIESTVPNELMVQYYQQRASAGLLITEATAISEEGGGWRNAPHIWRPEHVVGWQKVTEAVHARGSKIYLQLWHMGRQAHSSFHPATNRTVSASNIALKGAKVKTAYTEDVDGEVPHALTVAEIASTIEDYAHAAQLAKQADFDGVEIHAANGYLVDQFLQTVSNNRTDRYGGSRENRVRFLREIMDAIVESGAFPAHRIGVRLSPNGAYGDMGSPTNDTDFVYFAEVLNEYKPAYLHVMDGLGFGFHEKTRVVTVADIRQAFAGPIMSNVGLNRDTAEGMIRSGAADLAAFGRLYISNPDLVERFRHNWPVEPEALYGTWWQWTGAKGYTDWPTYEENTKGQLAAADLDGKEEIAASQ